MNKHNDSNIETTEKLKDIPKWTRRYAQNRAISVIVSLIIFACLFAGIALPSYFGGLALMKESMILFGICLFVVSVSIISLFFFSVPKWGGRFIERLSERFYMHEGTVSIPESSITKRKKWIGYVAGILFGSCVIGSVFLGFKEYIPLKYMQPVSALYSVPFMVFLYFWQKPKVSYTSLIWAILYAIHAILIVVGVPILFTGDLVFLNMMLPVFGYGFLSQIIRHVYSRHALKKLKSISHLNGDAVNGV